MFIVVFSLIKYEAFEIFDGHLVDNLQSIMISDVGDM